MCWFWGSTIGLRIEELDDFELAQSNWGITSLFAIGYAHQAAQWCTTINEIMVGNKTDREDEAR